MLTLPLRDGFNDWLTDVWRKWLRGDALSRSSLRQVARCLADMWYLERHTAVAAVNVSRQQFDKDMSSATPTAQHQLDHCYGACTASPAADQLQTRQTFLSGYFFPTARLLRWFDQPIQPVSFAAIIHTEASVSSAAQLGHCCSLFLCCCSETLELSSTELSNCSIR